MRYLIVMRFSALPAAAGRAVPCPQRREAPVGQIMSDQSTITDIPLDQLVTAVDTLLRGVLVAFTTETVYGLGADAGNPEAIAKLYKIKGRPAARPLTVHLADTAEIPLWVREVPPAAQKLIDRYCPGPLTLVLPRRPEIPDIVTAGADSVGIRLPSHPLARRLIRAFGRGLVAPSANRSGYLSPTTAEHVRREFGDEVPVVIDGGPCQLGLESTIVDFSTDTPRLLRAGLLTPEMLQETAGVAVAAPAEAPAATAGPHYRPRTPVRMCPSADLPAAAAAELSRPHHCLAVMYHSPELRFPQSPGLRLMQLPGRPEEYARSLYASLRYLDGCSLDAVIVEELPDTPSWEVLRQRLAQIARK